MNHPTAQEYFYYCTMDPYQFPQNCISPLRSIPPPARTDNNGLTTVCDQLGYIMFVVGKFEDKLYADKTFLASRSPVFHQLIFNYLHYPVLEIRHPEFQLKVFNSFLKFIYTNEVYPTPYEILDLFRLAFLYKVTSLTMTCTSLAKQLVSVETCIPYYKAAVMYDIEDLRKISFNFMLRNGMSILGQPHFLQMDSSSLALLMSNDSLIVPEVLLFKTLLKWIEAQCNATKNSEVKKELRSRVLNGLLRHIRFQLMTPDEFLKEVIPRALLSKTDVATIKLRHQSPMQIWTTLPPCPFIDRPRAPKFRYMVPLHQGADIIQYNIEMLRKMTVPLTYKETLRFLCTQDVYIAAVGLYGPRSDYAGLPPLIQYRVDICIQNDFIKSVLRGPALSTSVAAQDNFEIEFDNPYKIEKNQPHTLTVRLEGPVTQIGIFPVIPEVGVVLNDRGDIIKFQFISVDSVPSHQHSRCHRRNQHGPQEMKGLIRSLFFTIN